MKKNFEWNWKIDRFSFEKGFSFPSARCATIFLCNVLCMKKSFVSFTTSRMPLQWIVQHIAATFPDSIGASESRRRGKFCKHWITFLDYSWKSPHFEWGTFVAFSFALVRCVYGAECEGGKINEKKMFFACVTYVKIRCPRKTSPREKECFLSALSFSLPRSHTPFYGRLVGAHTKRLPTLSLAIEWKKNSWKEDKRIFFSVGSVRCLIEEKENAQHEWADSFSCEGEIDKLPNGALLDFRLMPFGYFRAVPLNTSSLCLRFHFY